METTMPKRDAALQQLHTGRCAAAVARDLGLSPRTVQVWWKQAQTPPTVPAPIFGPTKADEIAKDGTMWKDPWSGDLMFAIPGVDRATWEAERLAAKARREALFMSSDANQTAHQSAEKTQEADKTQPDSPAQMPDPSESAANPNVDSPQPRRDVYQEPETHAPLSTPPRDTVVIIKRARDYTPIQPVASIWQTVPPNIAAAVAVTVFLILLCSLVR